MGKRVNGLFLFVKCVYDEVKDEVFFGKMVISWLLLIDFG